jgi:tRNA pseudouridine55 synthase
VTALRRTRSGPFSLAEARPLDQILAALAAGDSAALPAVSLVDALAHLARGVVSDAVARDLRMGRRVPVTEVGGVPEGEPPSRLRLVDGGGALIAVAEVLPQDALAASRARTLRTLRVFGVPH